MLLTETYHHKVITNQKNLNKEEKWKITKIFIAALKKVALAS